MATAASEPTKLAAVTADTPDIDTCRRNDIASIAPSAAPAETPSVNGVASGLRSSAWKTTPAAASDGADEDRGHDARQPRDEEDLRVDVVGEGHAPSKTRSRLMRVVPNQRRADDAPRRATAPNTRRPAEQPRRRTLRGVIHATPSATVMAGSGSSRAITRPSGTTVRWPAGAWKCTSAVTP